VSLATPIARSRARPLARISPLIVGVVILAGCGTNATAAISHSSTTSVPVKRVELSAISSVSCADSMHCWAGGLVGRAGNDGAVIASANGGSTWTVQETIHGVDSIGPIDCPSDTHCFASDDRADSKEPPLLLSTTDGGKSWSTQAMPSDVSELDAISCTNDFDCWLVGGQPQTENDIVMATTNWGGSWTVQDRSSIEISMGVSYGMSCASTADCAIVGYGGLTTRDGGSAWEKHSLPGGELNAVSCASESHCVAEGDVTSAIPSSTSTDIATSNDGGTSWKVRVARESGGVGDLGSLSCPTTTDCVSVGSGYASAGDGQYSYWGAVERTSDGGQTWTRVKEPQASSLNGVSCAAGTTDCIAVGELNASAGVILKTVNDGSSWSVVPLLLL
jgi:photosystem II stability/assembly factor-like uncharacterized protein